MKRYFIAVNKDENLLELDPPTVVEDPELHHKNANFGNGRIIEYQYIPLGVASAASGMVDLLKKMIDAGLSFREFVPLAEELIKKAEQ